MATLKHHKVTALPGTLQGDAIYYVRPSGTPDYVEVYVTNAAGTNSARVMRPQDVQALIDAAVTGLGRTEVVATIAARNALTAANGMTVLVLDATGDGTVASGAATYVYRAAASAWAKISEAESLDLALTWAALTGKPTSTVAAIDDAVTKRHAHANATELGRIGQDGDGNLTYDGQLPRARLEAADW